MECHSLFSEKKEKRNIFQNFVSRLKLLLSMLSVNEVLGSGEVNCIYLNGLVNCWHELPDNFC